jgi:hypothetical protein
VIKIRYMDLPAGVHVRTTSRGSHTVVFLLHGLTPAQRQAAIRRARGAAQVGQGPPLPRAALVLALAADRLRATVRNGFGAMRMHPAIFFPPLVIVLSAAVAYLLLVSVTIRFRPGSQPPGPGGAATGAAAPPGRAVALGPGPGHHPARPPVPGGSSSPAPSIPGPSPSTVPPTTQTPVPPVKSPSPPRSSPGSPPARPPVPSPSPSSDPAPSPLPSHEPSPSPTASPAPTPTGSGGGTVCVMFGQLVVCVTGL